MQREIGARVAIAGPAALLAALVGMAVAAALSNIVQWPIFVVAALLPVAISVWLSQGATVAIRAVLAVVSVAASIGIAAVVSFVVVPLFEVSGVGISGTGVHTLLWGPFIVVLLGSLAARARLNSPLIGAWLLWWVAAAAGVYWAEPFTYALTDMAGADAMAGSIAVLATPTLGMSAWLGTVLAVLLYRRLTRGHPTMASTPTIAQ